MFTGIIQGRGKVENISKSKKGGKAAELEVNLGKLAKGLKMGDSVSINGTCLTVVNIQQNKISFEIIGETIKKTALRSLVKGDMVNVECSLRIGDTIDGHFVLGHVDGVGKIINQEKKKDETKLWISTNKKLLKYIAPKGSIAIDGISLTLVDVVRNKISVSLIPHTLAVTTLGLKKKGDKVNIEIDILGRYANKILTGK